MWLFLALGGDGHPQDISYAVWLEIMRGAQHFLILGAKDLKALCIRQYARKIIWTSSLSHSSTASLSLCTVQTI